MVLCRLFILRPASPGKDNLLSQGCVWAGLARRSPGRLAGLCNRDHIHPPLRIRCKSVELSDLGPPYAMYEHSLLVPFALPWLLASDRPVTRNHQKQHDTLSHKQLFSRGISHCQCQESGQATNTGQKGVEKKKTSADLPELYSPETTFIFLIQLICFFFSFLTIEMCIQGKLFQTQTQRIFFLECDPLNG